MNHDVVWLSHVPSERAEDKWDAEFVKEMTRPFASMVSNSIQIWDKPSVIVLPAGVHADAQHVGKVREELSHLERVVLVLTADEQCLFPVHQVKHAGVRVWRQTPRSSKDGDRFFGYCLPPDTELVHHVADRSIDVVFVGQVTHERRQQCFDAAHSLGVKKLVLGTGGFTQGFPRSVYLKYLAESRIALCPAGAATPDTFRVYEALEAGCVPVVDALRPDTRSTGYWRLVYGEDCPLPRVTRWDEELGSVVRKVLRDWDAWQLLVAAWWEERKQMMCDWMKEDVAWTRE